MTTSPHHNPRVLSSPPLFVLNPLSWTSAAASDHNGAQATRRCRSWGGVRSSPSPSLRYVLYTSLRVPPPFDPSLSLALGHHARLCFCTQVSHITAGGCLCLSGVAGFGKRSVAAGVDTNAYYFFLHTDIPPLDFALVESLNTWTLGRHLLMQQLLCMHAESGFHG